MTPAEWYARLATLGPDVETASEKRRRALVVLGWDVQATTVHSAGYGAGLVVGLVAGVTALFVPGRFRLAALLGAVAAALCVTHAVQTLPVVWARARRTRALGATPDLVTRLTLRMRLTPAPETAGAFAASGDGLLANSLDEHLRAVRGSPQSGLESFGETWGETFPALRRAVTLVRAGGEAPQGDRERLLDRAVTAVFEGTRNQMQTFAGRIRSPVTALYAFGVLLPTALVALLPAASAAGLPVTPLSVVVVYNLLVPGILVVATVKLLVERPVAFPPPNVGADHPDVPGTQYGLDRRLVVAGAGIGTAVCGWVGASLFLPPWGPPVTAVGLGCGTALWLWYRPVVEVYDHIRATEEGLPDALELLGRRVADGQAIERALGEVATELDGATTVVLEAAVTRQRQLNIDVDAAFFGNGGVLEHLPSRRVRGSLGLLDLAAAEGRPAGEAMLGLANHVDDLQSIEREARHSLAHVCRTLRSTGTVFGPLVAGATVALADGIGGEGYLPGGEQSLPWLGSVVGVYALVLAVVLVALATGLTRGLDRSLVGYRVGGALVGATASYLAAYLAVSAIV